jgi:hypothetical protein
MSAMDDDELIHNLLAGAKWLKTTAAAAPEYLVAKDATLNVREIAEAMETAALRIGRFDADTAQLRERKNGLRSHARALSIPTRWQE